VGDRLVVRSVFGEVEGHPPASGRRFAPQYRGRSRRCCLTTSRTEAARRSIGWRGLPGPRGAPEANTGQSAAFDAGFRLARGGLVVTLDADLQNDPADIPRLVARLEETGADAVIGVRASRRDTLVRRVSSRIGNSVRNALTRDRVTDTGCSLKVYRRHAIAGIKMFRGMHRFLPTLIRIEGHEVLELPVGHRERRHGVSKYGIANRALSGLADVLAVRWMSARTLRYKIRESGPSMPEDPPR
jgi:glycosyltransferase involved in cell wall biosynthesis